jgi:multimeric flavodoxin WrbA
MKVVAFVGSARKKHTYHATEQFLQNLKTLGEVECEIVRLSDYNLKTCQGCLTCLNKGEEHCPLKDDRDQLIDKIMTSNGIILATPNYSFQVSGFMKVFLDRLGFVFHRPRFFGKAYTSIVAQGIYGGGKIVSYFDFIGNALGFNVVKGSCIRSIEPVTEKTQKQTDKMIDKQSKRFYAKLVKREFPSPSLIKLMAFRMSRSSINKILDEKFKDYRYFQEKGWFRSAYYYPVHLNLLKKGCGRLFDYIGKRMGG